MTQLKLWSLVFVAGVFAIGMSTASGSTGEISSGEMRETASQTERSFRFEYRIEVPATQDLDRPTRLFVPIATDSPAQDVLDVQIRSPIEGTIGTESKYGNRFWQAEIPSGRAEPVEIKFTYEIRRRVDRAQMRSSEAQPAARFLTPNERVAVDHPILHPILAEIRAASPNADQAGRARAIYDWVVSNVEYKKVGNGWGNGDTFWACNERYGNCTDFHSLFISLARTEGIPAKFEMGFPVPDDRDGGEIAGYHCWVAFWLPERGWVPIDASEAFKYPEKRDFYFGSHPADRLHFSTGRDLRLGPDHQGPPLNYFIYPYTEIDGRSTDLEIKTGFRYRDHPRDSAGQRAQENASDAVGITPRAANEAQRAQEI